MTIRKTLVWGLLLVALSGGCAAVVGIDTYGESAPGPVLFKHFGFTAENVADAVKVAVGAARLKGKG